MTLLHDNFNTYANEINDSEISEMAADTEGYAHCTYTSQEYGLAQMWKTSPAKIQKLAKFYDPVISYEDLHQIRLATDMEIENRGIKQDTTSLIHWMWLYSLDISQWCDDHISDQIVSFTCERMATVGIGYIPINKL